MSTITGTELWVKINTKPDFATLPESLRTAIQPYIEVMPEVLISLLDSPVTIDVIMQATAKYLHYCRNHGYIRVTVQATPEHMRRGSSAEEMERSIDELYQQAIILAEVLSSPQNVQDLLASTDETESELMVKIGLSDEALARYQEGNLTLGELLQIDPSLFFQKVAN